MKTNLSCAIALSALLACSGASAVTLGPYTGSWGAGDDTQLGRIYRDGTSSTAGTAKAFPGVSNSSSTYLYETFLFQNLGGPDAITVDATVSSANTVFAAFSGSSYDPVFANNAGTYLGDLGTSTSHPFSFTAPTGAFMVVAMTTGSSTVGNFSFTVDGANVSAVSAVPEPSTLVMFGLGVLGVIARRRQAA